MNGFNEAWSGYLPVVDAEPARGVAGLRLLPWTGPDGKPTYTPDDNPEGMIARLADRMEREQLTAASDLLGLARQMLAGTEPLTPDQSRFIVARLCNVLSNTLQVAESRGMRLTTGGADA
ncbi:hypothetical protein [Actinacidiphila glaucinigra]|uniref:hypothetical protein n=1 Tax=Actinacidiphila glaucinigra TaxID=235986 RepID=UPI00366AE09D